MADPKPLQCTCPACGAYGVLELFLTGEENTAVATLMGQIGNAALARDVARYMGVFRPRQRRLTAARAQRLLAELVPMIVAQRVRFDGRDQAAPTEAWASALREMLDMASSGKLELPLEGHNYLLRVVSRMAPSIAAAVEDRLESERRTQSRQRVPSDAPAFVESLEEYVARRRVTAGVGTDADRALVQAAAERRQAATDAQRLLPPEQRT